MHIWSLQEAHQTLEDLQASLKQVSDKIQTAVQYFCQDASKFKLEELLAEILTFVKDFTSAKKVMLIYIIAWSNSMCGIWDMW